MEGSGFGFQSFFTRDLNTFSRDGKDPFGRERLRQGQEDDPSDRQALHRSSPLFLCHRSEGEGPGEAEGKSRASVAGAQGDSCLTHCHHSRVLRVMEAVVSTTATSSRGISVSNLPSLCLFPHLKYGTVTPTSEATVRTH